MIVFLVAVLFVALFVFAQGVIYLIKGTTPAKEAQKKIEKIKQSSFFDKVCNRKAADVKKDGCRSIIKRSDDSKSVVFIQGSDDSIVWNDCGIYCRRCNENRCGKAIIVIATFGWFFLDIFLRASNKSSNDEMMPDYGNEQICIVCQERWTVYCRCIKRRSNCSRK